MKQEELKKRLRELVRETPVCLSLSINAFSGEFFFEEPLVLVWRNERDTLRVHLSSKNEISIEILFWCQEEGVYPYFRRVQFLNKKDELKNELEPILGRKVLENLSSLELAKVAQELSDLIRKVIADGDDWLVEDYSQTR